MLKKKCHDFLSKVFFCLTKPKNFVEEHFRVAFQKFCGKGDRSNCSSSSVISLILIFQPFTSF